MAYIEYDSRTGTYWSNGMLISQDLMRHLAKFVEPPAQLCLIRVLGSDHEYVFRVRYNDAHLDYPCVVPLLSASKVEELCNWDEVVKFCAVASAMVVPPGERTVQNGTLGRRQPQILAPMPYHQSPYYRSF